MNKRVNNAQYFYIGSYGNIQMDRDTGAARHQFRFDLGNYLTREEAKKKQLATFKRIYPNLSDIDLRMKIMQAEDL